ncbi:MAG: ROK family protein, partial [Actinobacteria bacterium]|nr:ROK family protein [Actinomycetota bacterium]
RDVSDFVVVTIGSGIGCGIVANGNFYYGYSGAAGEFGHIKVTEDGPICECGKRGCLEALAAEPAIVRKVLECIKLGEESTLRKVLFQNREITIEDVLKAAKEGDSLAQRIYHSAGTYLGMGIANLVNIINPQRVIVSGEGLRAGELLTSPMIKAFQENCFPSIKDVTELVIEPLGDDAWARGAASLVIEEIFKAKAFIYKNGKLRVTLYR